MQEVPRSPAGTVLGVAAHPDDIEFMMSGTMMLLGDAGFDLHYMNVANGSCGTAVLPRDEIVAIRTREAQQAAQALGAVFHSPLVDDIDILYDPIQLRRLGAVVRQVAPDILLLQAPEDYMEDHTNCARLGVTAAFCRGMRNFVTEPPVPPVDKPVAVYHALPWGLQDQLRRPVQAEFYVDVSGVLSRKRSMLACHRSQKEWLDKSQGLDSYLNTMEDNCRAMGAASGRFEYAEGWRRHSHLGFCDEQYDPLTAALADRVEWNRGYQTQRR